MEKKRFSAGLLFKTNKVCLDQEVLELQEERVRGIEEKMIQQSAKAKNEFQQRKIEAEEVMKLNKTAEQLLNPQLRCLVMWKKRKGDKACPTQKQDLIQRFNETYHRHDLTLEQHLKEQGKEINEMIAENMHQEGEEEDENIAASSEHDETQQFGRI